MTRCDTCDGFMSQCDCGKEESCVYRLAELDHFVWAFEDLVTITTVEEDDGRVC